MKRNIFLKYSGSPIVIAENLNALVGSPLYLAGERRRVHFDSFFIDNTFRKYENAVIEDIGNMTTRPDRWMNNSDIVVIVKISDES